MSDYAPTTEQVREAVRDWWFEDGTGGFDRWLSRYAQQVRRDALTLDAEDREALAEVLADRFDGGMWWSDVDAVLDVLGFTVAGGGERA